MTTFHVHVIANATVSVTAETAEEAEQIVEDYRKADKIPYWMFENGRMVVDGAKHVNDVSWHIYEKLEDIEAS